MPRLFSIQTPPENEAFVNVVFEKRFDRWAHRIEWVTSVKTILIAASIEGTPDDEWPPSQPLQEITRIEQDGLPVLLGVGMAGRSHWSFSCSLEPESSENAGSIFFDLACLVKTTPTGWLGSSYRLGPEVTTGNCHDHRVELKIGDIEIRVASRASQRLDHDWGTRFLMVKDELKIKPAVMSTSPTTATRWDFAVEVGKKPRRPE